MRVYPVLGARDPRQNSIPSLHMSSYAGTAPVRTAPPRPYPLRVMCQEGGKANERTRLFYVFLRSAHAMSAARMSHGPFCARVTRAQFPSQYKFYKCVIDPKCFSISFLFKGMNVIVLALVIGPTARSLRTEWK